jgi:ATP-binding protein involved in chromosome partitioning
MITEKQVLFALSHVQEPDLKKDLVTLNMIKDIKIEGNHIQFTIVLTTPACPLKDKMKDDSIAAIHAHVSADATIQVDFTANVSTNRSDKFVLPGVRNIIAIMSGKGGVGKSTVASNLAIALAQTGAKVGLLDADIYGPSQAVMFGLEGQQPFMEDVNGKSFIVPLESHGVKLISIAFLLRPDQAVAWRGPMVSSALKQFVSEVSWGELDYLILDMPPGTGDIHLTLLQTVPLTGVVMVTTPQQVALADAQKGALLLGMMPSKIPMLGVVENMAWFTPAELPNNRYPIFGKGAGEQLAKQFGAPLLAQIPLYMEIMEGADTGKPAALQQNTPYGEIYTQLAQAVAQQIAIKNADGIAASN